jgi:hypothetical protein
LFNEKIIISSGGFKRGRADLFILSVYDKAKDGPFLLPKAIHSGS